MMGYEMSGPAAAVEMWIYPTSILLSIFSPISSVMLTVAATAMADIWTAGMDGHPAGTVCHLTIHNSECNICLNFWKLTKEDFVAKFSFYMQTFLGFLLVACETFTRSTRPIP